MDRLTYYLIRFFTAPFAIMPFRLIHAIGNGLGILAYYTLFTFRKRALSNLALATDLHLSHKEIVRTAKKSFQSLLITALEYPKYSLIKSLRNVKCVNPEKAQNIVDSGTGIIFFVAHQANWELLFLDGTKRMPGVAIGRPTKNRFLYNWVKSIREKFGGTIIDQKSALRGSLRALRQGKFVGIVGDQGLPESDFSSQFLGRRAFTSPLPAILAYRTGCPIIFADIHRENSAYTIHYSDPFYADTSKSLEEETDRLMGIALGYLETSIKKCPEQWLWIHNRWKQETPKDVFYRFRQDSILIVSKGDLDLSIFRKIYPRAFLTFKKPEELTTDYQYKLVYDFTEDTSLKKHFPAALEIITPTKMKKLSSNEQNLEKLILQTVTRHACK